MKRESSNQQIAANIEKGSALATHGMPQHYPDAKTLVTADCIKPSSKEGL